VINDIKTNRGNMVIINYKNLKWVCGKFKGT